MHSDIFSKTKKEGFSKFRSPCSLIPKPKQRPAWEGDFYLDYFQLLLCLDKVVGQLANYLWHCQCTYLHMAVPLLVS